MQISTSLEMTIPPKRAFQSFRLQDFSNGEGVKGGEGWVKGGAYPFTHRKCPVHRLFEPKGEG